MSDIRFNQWLHQSGTGGVSQVDGGHVGIGTTNPDIAVHTANAKKLNVGIVTANSVYAGNFYGSGSNLTGVGHVDKIIEGDTKVEVFDAGSQYISAEVNGSERLRIDSNGNVTIKDAKQLLFENDAQNASSAILNLGASGTSNLIFATGGAEKARIDSTGKLLIGTTTEGNATGDDLTISNAGNMGLTLRSTNSSYCNIYFSDATGGTAEYEGYMSYNHATDSLEFATVHTERLRIDSSGRLLIGTTTVGDSTADNLTIADSGTCGITIRSGTSGEGNIFFSDGTSGAATYAGTIQYKHASDSLNIHVAVSERLRILSNGHVAIGDDIANDTGMFKVIAADGQSDDQYVGQFKNLEATANRNWGLLIQAGSSSTDESLRVRNYANNRDHLLIRGDGVKVTQSRGGNYAKTFEFNYNDGAPGGQQTKSLATISTYNDVTSAVAEVTYVGVYGTANNYISSSKWICAVRRGNNNSVWNQTAAETATGGNSGTSSLDIYWSNGQLYAQTVGPWMGWTVNVRLTILNGDITVNV